MNCPSCNFRSVDNTAYCIRCGFSLAHYGRSLAQFNGISTWLLRRSLAGGAAGMAGWLIIPAAARMAGASLGQTGHLLLSGAIGGVFLGTVEGMMEESALKTLWGGAAGVIGATIGSLAAAALLSGNAGSSGLTAVAVTWGLTGMGIGIVSAWLERRWPRIVAGALVGFLGGALGGWLGYQMYASLSDIAKIDTWGLRRIVESATGTILGAVMWFAIALAERLFIFRRRRADNISYKECDLCHYTNVLKAWYCASCGSVLQISAPPEKLELPRRQALARFIAACEYLGRLCGTTSAVVALLAAYFLGSINVFLGLFGLLLTALIGYIAYVLFNALAEALSPLL